MRKKTTAKPKAEVSLPSRPASTRQTKRPRKHQESPEEGVNTERKKVLIKSTKSTGESRKLDDVFQDKEVVAALNRAGRKTDSGLRRMLKWDEDLRRETSTNEWNLNAYQVGAVIQALRGEEHSNVKRNFNNLSRNRQRHAKVKISTQKKVHHKHGRSIQDDERRQTQRI